MSKRVRDAQERGYPSKAYNPAACLYPLLALTDEEKEKYHDYKRVEGLAVRGCGISKGRLREFWKNLYKPSVRMKKQEEKKAVIEKIEALRKYIRFSPREIEVLGLYLEGKGDAEILKKLNISENALMQYRSFIAGKVKPFVRLPQGARVNKMPTSERQALSIINHSIAKRKEKESDDLQFLFQQVVIRPYIERTQGRAV